MDELVIQRLGTVSDEEMVLNMGPQHPSTHGVIRFVVKADGEIMKVALPVVGYLHRAIEKIGEIVTFPGFMPYTDRADYLAAMFANEGYALAVERLMGLEVPVRAQYCRALSCELNRIASHLVSVGTMGQDIGAMTPFLHALREREKINDLIEELCGARLTYNYHRIGGVAFDVPADWGDKTLRFVEHFEKILDEYDRLLTWNEIYVKRLSGLGVIPAAMAIDYGLVGPNLRASGVDWDVRRDIPYGCYKDFEYAIPVGKGWVGKVGDSFDRYYVRILEMRESCKIIKQALQKLPPGEIVAPKIPKKMKPPAGEAWSRVESARGEMGYYVTCDGGEKATRVRIRTGSFTAMGIVKPLSRGMMLADLVAFIASLDVVAPEIDR